MTRGAGEAAFVRGARLPIVQARPASTGVVVVVDVVAVEAEPGFEAQRIARAEPDRLDLRLGAAGLRRCAAASSAGTEISKPSSPV